MNTAQTIMAGFELSNFDSVDLSRNIFDVVISRNADGDPISGFHIVGKNSIEFQTAFISTRQSGIKRSAKRSQAIDTSTDEGAALVAKTVDDNEKVFALAVTVGWFGFNLEGQPAEFDKSIVEKMFTKYPVWQKAVNLALDNDANFMKV